MAILKWEYMESAGYADGEFSSPTAIYRAKVPGGWLVLTSNSSSVYRDVEEISSVSNSLAFIPDPRHEWS